MENRNSYFAMIVYKNSLYHGCIRDPETVSKNFTNDFKNNTPIHFSKNVNRYYITFAINNCIVSYELPIDFDFVGGK